MLFKFRLDHHVHISCPLVYCMVRSDVPSRFRSLSNFCLFSFPLLV